MYFGTLYRIYDVINKTVTYLSQVAVTPVPVLAAASKVAFSPAETGGGGGGKCFNIFSSAYFITSQLF